MPRKRRTGRYRRLSQRKTSLGLNLKWLLVLVLVDVIILRPHRVLATNLEVLPRGTHLHLNAIFVFSVFIVCAHSFHVISRLKLVLIFASLVIRLHGIVRDCVKLITAPAGLLQDGLRPLL